MKSWFYFYPKDKHGCEYAVLRICFDTMPTLKCTENPNTLIYPIHDPTAISVIQVSIPESSGAQYAERLFQNEKVSVALHALRIAISSVLDPDENNETLLSTNETEKRIGNIPRKKKSISKPGDGS